MVKIEIEGQTYTYDTPAELWADIETKFTDVFAHNFQLYHQEDGECVEGIQ